MSDRTYVFDNADGGFGGNGMGALIASLCNKQGIDPGYLMAMMNQNGMNGGGWWAWILILLIFGWSGFGGNGFGGRGNAQGLADLGNLVNSDNGRELIMSAIQGNSTAISQLASTLNCDVNALQTAINGVQQQICNVGNQVGLTGQQVINAIQMGNANIASELCNCCCTLRSDIASFKGDIQLQNCQNVNALQNSINTVNTSVERGFASTNYETFKQTCDILNAMESNTNKILEGQRAAEMREMQNKIDSLREQNQTLQFAASQQAQNAYLINQLQPVAKPAYLTCSPYQAAYGFNPYGYLNNGCGCNGNGYGC